MDREFTQYNIINNIDRNILPFKKINDFKIDFFIFYVHKYTKQIMSRLNIEIVNQKI